MDVGRSDKEDAGRRAKKRSKQMGEGDGLGRRCCKSFLP